MFDRERFISDLRWLALQNVPWRHQGSNPETGVDCIGCAKWAYEQQGLTLPAELAEAFSVYHRPPNGRHMLAVMRRHLFELQFDEIQPADLVVIYVHRNPCHMMIKLSEKEYAEAFENLTGVSHFRITSFDPLSRVAACFRIPDFD